MTQQMFTCWRYKGGENYDIPPNPEWVKFDDEIMRFEFRELGFSSMYPDARGFTNHEISNDEGQHPTFRDGVIPSWV